MYVSIRSHLIAGTAAVVGATAVALTPTGVQHDLLLPAIPAPSASSEVALAGLDSPITEFILSLGVTNTYLFSDVPWQTYSPWSDLSALGVVPQIITDALPVIRQLGLNGSDYLYQTGRGLGTSAYLISEGVWNAAGDILSLDVSGAISTLVTAVQAAGTEALATGNYVLTGVLTRASAVVNALATLVPDIATAVVNQARVLVGSVVKVITDTIDALGSANPVENTWNAVVDGLFGPTGIPGVLNAITIGYGVDPSVQMPTFVPSVRTVLTTVVTKVAKALDTTNPAPPPAAATPSAAALRSAATDEAPAVATDSTGGSAADDATPGDSSKTDSPDAGTSKAGGNHSRSTGGSKRAHKSAD